MRKDRIAGLHKFNAEQGDIGRFAVVFGDVVIVNEPELLHEILVTKAKSFEKSPILRTSLYPLAGDGLFTSEGELWKKQRRLMAPMFQPAGLRHFADDMVRCTDRAASTWRDGDTVEIARETTRITMVIAGKNLFDEDTFSESDALGGALTTALEWAGTESSNPALIAQARAQIGLELIADRVPAMLAGSLRKLADRLRAPILWPGARSRALKDAVAVLDARVARMIADRRKDTATHRDLLSLLLDARDDDGAAMSDRQVRDEVLTLFVAGHETTATALAWAVMLLCQNPEAYARVRAEVDAIGRLPTMDDLGRLSYCLRVFKESMRLYPPVYLFGRVTITPVDIGDFHFRKGTVVLVSPYALHRREKLWPEPERFDPDRFLPEAEARRHKSAFIPFSAGPRTCIGNHFALMEGPLVLATLFHHADFELIDPNGTEPDPQATLRPKTGIPARITRRRPSAS